MLSVLRWHIYTKDAADQIRAGTMAGFLSGRYRQTVARINREDRTAADQGARMSLVGAVCGGLGSAVVWAAVVWLLATGRITVGHLKHGRLRPADGRHVGPRPGGRRRTRRTHRAVHG